MFRLLVVALTLFVSQATLASAEYTVSIKGTDFPLIDIMENCKKHPDGEKGQLKCFHSITKLLKEQFGTPNDARANGEKTPSWGEFESALAAIQELAAENNMMANQHDHMKRFRYDFDKPCLISRFQSTMIWDGIRGHYNMKLETTSLDLRDVQKFNRSKWGAAVTMKRGAEISYGYGMIRAPKQYVDAQTVWQSSRGLRQLKKRTGNITLVAEWEDSGEAFEHFMLVTNACIQGRPLEG